MGKDGPTRGDQVHVAAFGKHPGWDDHIEEIGLDCAPLVNAKRVLYTEGMSGNIDAGAWERLADEQRLASFKHQFFWRLPEGLIVGRMWSSRDGKGRTKYPMIVCAFVEGAPTAWSIAQIPRRLAAVESKCVGTNAAELVRLAIGEARRALEDELAILRSGGGGPAPAGDDAALLKRLVEHPDLSGGGPAQVGLTRVLYEIEREMGAYRSSTGTTRMSRTSADNAGAQHLRVPRCLAEGGEAARAWLTLLHQEVSDYAPVLVLEPAGETFIDLVVGMPSPAQLFCVRAAPKGLALTTDVPYSIDAGFSAQAAGRVNEWRAGRVRTTQKAPSAPATGGDGGGKKKWPLYAGIGAGAVVLIVLLLVLTSGGSNKEAESGDAPARAREPSETEPRASTPAPKAGPSETTPAPASDGDGDRAGATPARAPASGSPANGPAASGAPGAPRVVAEASPTYPEGDPRAGWSFVEWVNAAGESIATLEREARDAGETPNPEFRQRLERAVERESKFIRTANVTPTTRASVVRDMASVEREVKEVAAGVDAALARLHARAREDLAARAAKASVTTEAMRAAWVRGVARIDLSKGRKAAFDQVESLERAIVQAERDVLGVAFETPALDEANTGALEAQATARRDAALVTAADGVIAGEPARAEGVVRELRAWGDARRDVLDKAAASERALALGAASDERIAEAASPAELLRAMRQSSVWKDVGVALAPLEARIEALAKIESSGDAPMLVRTIREAGADQARVRASEALGAWRALEKAGWPASKEDLREAGALRAGEVEGVVSRIADAARRERARAGATQTARAMWKAWMGGHATDEAGVRDGIDTRSAMGVTDEDVASLPSFVRFNIARHRLEEAVAKAAAQSGAARDAAQRAAMDAFVKDVEALDVSKSGPAAGLLAAVKPLREKGAQLDLSALGPGGAGWKLSRAEGDGVTFEWQHQGRTHRQEFRRVEADAGEDVGFVSTTEMSVGLFADLVSAAGKWELLRGAGGAAGWLPSSEVGGVDPRRGPRAWVWSGETIQPAAAGTGDTSMGWIGVSAKMSGKAYYPEGLAVEAPTAQSPMQQVPVKAAVLAARLAGCRLPTPAEWAGAAGESGAAGGTENRRDATWRRQFEFVKSLDAANDPEYPSAGVFRQTRVQPGADGEPAVATDDGVLWFAPVDGGTPSAGGFRHVVGNVAEFVLDGEASAQLVAPTREAIEGLIGKNGANVRVMGASALSPAEIAPESAERVRAVQVNVAFSDVGFRLAFSAPRAAGAAGAGDRLRAALAEFGYMGGEAK
ncbi:MAG: SUMF1/EgtB/PvdO family nonheme iron enzyme [Planctomycetota bacterium]|nr:SUMF1/EgtB/PvdO family nonheme iron enzyme [Planctomycetota bacterium]